MTTCLGKSCPFGLPRVPFVNCCQFMYLVISLLVLRAGCGIWLYQFLIITYLFTFLIQFHTYLYATFHIFFHDLKMCIWFGFNPAVNFCHFSTLLTLSFFNFSQVGHQLHRSSIYILGYMSRDMTKPTKWVCAQRRLRSDWASAQSDQSLRCALNG